MSDACCGPAENRPVAEEFPGGEREPEKFWQVTEIRLALISGVLLLSGWLADARGVQGWVPTLLEAAALLLAGWTFVPSTVRRLLKGRMGVGTLMTIAAVGALLLGQLAEAAALAFLYAIAEGLEEYSVARARRGLRALLDLAPKEARVLRHGTETTVAPADLRPGDPMVVRPGERLPPTGSSELVARLWIPRR